MSSAGGGSGTYCGIFGNNRRRIVECDIKSKTTSTVEGPIYSRWLLGLLDSVCVSVSISVNDSVDVSVSVKVSVSAGP